MIRLMFFFALASFLAQPALAQVVVQDRAFERSQLEVVAPAAQEPAWSLTIERVGADGAALTTIPQLMSQEACASAAQEIANATGFFRETFCVHIPTGTTHHFTMEYD
jgi:hypothetical protein